MSSISLKSKLPNAMMRFRPRKNKGQLIDSVANITPYTSERISLNQRFNVFENIFLLIILSLGGVSSSLAGTGEGIHNAMGGNEIPTGIVETDFSPKLVISSSLDLDNVSISYVTTAVEPIIGSDLDVDNGPIKEDGEFSKLIAHLHLYIEGRTTGDCSIQNELIVNTDLDVDNGSSSSDKTNGKMDL
ncbi:MAG: hypothetical protein JKY52_15415 [Flavobacteriales bacterium]|nr:hypothetical protein [Flavobacteriales bacterium]